MSDEVLYQVYHNYVKLKKRLPLRGEILGKKEPPVWAAQAVWGPQDFWLKD
jgi:hypothetical protein